MDVSNGTYLKPYSCFISCHNLCIAVHCPHLAQMWNNVLLPQRAMVSQELVLIFHHYCLISRQCAWRPVLVLTFSEGKACSTTQRKWGARQHFFFFCLSVRVSLLMYLWLFFLKACLTFFFFLWKTFLPCGTEFAICKAWETCRQIQRKSQNAFAAYKYKHGMFKKGASMQIEVSSLAFLVFNEISSGGVTGCQVSNHPTERLFFSLSAGEREHPHYLP